MSLRIDISALGAVRDSEEFRVNTRRLAQFAAALGDDHPERAEGRVAHPVFAHVPTMQGMVEALGRAAPGAAPLHGEHDLQIHRPIEPGMRLFSLSALVGLRPTAAGAALLVRSTTETAEGDLVATQTATCLIPGAALHGPEGLSRTARPPEAEAPEQAVAVELPPDQARRYAEAARDYSPYTLDAEAAAAMGFAAPILHGMCTLGLAANAVAAAACGGDARRIARLGCRFSAPLLMRPGQTLTTRIRAAGDLISFAAADAEGREVIRHGYARLRA